MWRRGEQVRRRIGKRTSERRKEIGLVKRNCIDSKEMKGKEGRKGR